MSTDIIRVIQAPIIEESLANIAAVFDDDRKLAEETEATEENLKTLKDARATCRKYYDDLETRRKEAKTTILNPYEAFERLYKDQIADRFKKADDLFKQKIDEIEDAKRLARKNQFATYYAEYAQSKSVDDLITFDQSKVQLNLTDSDTKITRMIREEIDKVASDRAAAEQMENGKEIIFEYRRTRDLAAAIAAVKERHAYTKTDEPQEQPKEKPRAHAPEEILTCHFTVSGTKSQLLALKRYLAENGIEIID